VINETSQPEIELATEPSTQNTAHFEARSGALSPAVCVCVCLRINMSNNNQFEALMDTDAFLLESVQESNEGKQPTVCIDVLV